MKIKDRLPIERTARGGYKHKIYILAVLLLGMMWVGGTGLQSHPRAGGAVQPLANFDASKLEAPESIAIDVEGNISTSLVLTGEIRKIAPDGTQTTPALLPIGPPLT